MARSEPSLVLDVHIKSPGSVRDAAWCASSGLIAVGLQSPASSTDTVVILDPSAPDKSVNLEVPLLGKNINSLTEHDPWDLLLQSRFIDFDLKPVLRSVWCF
jgi:hypothetical protein